MHFLGFVMASPCQGTIWDTAAALNALVAACSQS